MPITTINSRSDVTDIEQHFKVLAGPGAGKTGFLVHHIKNLLTNSKRLGISRKIACITYTNIAAETILSRLGDHGGRLEISTIHSFLYKNLVKPYVHLIANDYGLDALAINGHDDVVISSYKFLDDWKVATKQQRLRDDNDIVYAFGKIRWKFNSNNELIISSPYPMQSGTLTIKTDSYLVYKRMLWEKGLLHHDDVLFFSYELIRKKPFLLEVLRAIFPYFLVDEFQDTSPIQISILESIATKESIVGVVGDEAQSIYKFLGAVPGQLQSFNLPGIADYQIEDNWRSSNQIVALLNQLRPDLQQQPLRNFNSADVYMLVGKTSDALSWITTMFTGAQLITLSRENITANVLKKGLDNSFHTDLLVELKKIDKSERRKTMSAVVKAVEYAKMGYFKDALKVIGRLNNYNTTESDKRTSLKHLKILLHNENEYVGKPIMELYNLVNKEKIAVLAGFKTGAPKAFYETTTYEQLAIAVKNLYEAGDHRTIHKSKGDEFEAVMLNLEIDNKGQFNDSKELEFLLAPDIFKKEDHRVMYVALSRAKDFLFISVPQLSPPNKIVVEKLGIAVELVS